MISSKNIGMFLLGASVGGAGMYVYLTRIKKIEFTKIVHEEFIPKNKEVKVEEVDEQEEEKVINDTTNSESDSNVSTEYIDYTKKVMIYEKGEAYKEKDEEDEEEAPPSKGTIARRKREADPMIVERDNDSEDPANKSYEISEEEYWSDGGYKSDYDKEDIELWEDGFIYQGSTCNPELDPLDCIGINNVNMLIERYKEDHSKTDAFFRNDEWAKDWEVSIMPGDYDGMHDDVIEQDKIERKEIEARLSSEK